MFNSLDWIIEVSTAALLSSTPVFSLVFALGLRILTADYFADHSAAV
jgi:hypothetical protein